MKTYFSQTALSRRLNLAPVTLVDRLRKTGTEPDAVIITASRKPGRLFDADRLPELRRVLSVTPQIVA